MSGDVDEDESPSSSSSSSQIELTLQRNDAVIPSRDEDHDDDPVIVSSSVHNNDDLNVLQAAALLTADVLGTGLLALPQNIKVLGKLVGLTFLILNLPLNWFAGLILSRAASLVERHVDDDKDQSDGAVVVNGDGVLRGATVNRKSPYTSVAASEDVGSDNERNNIHQTSDDAVVAIEDASSSQLIIDTHDYIGMTQALFSSRMATRVVTVLFYTNIFLVLGDYILVMSHAVAAIVDICIPHAGLVASTLMLALSQLRTMALLGRTVTATSLMCLTIVVIQCLVAGERQEVQQPPSDTSWLRQLSALASIAFATGSNKLLLNIRREMKQRNDSPKSLGISSVIFGSVYVSISVLAGPNPPPFLFDSIPHGTPRKVAGFLLWIHVAVSYAINSQAICASIERRYFHRFRPRQRWLTLTLCLSISSYLVANIVPFFKDLVALIGALTSVPLTLLLPVILYVRACRTWLVHHKYTSWASWGLFVFGLVVLIGGLIGTVGSIVLDWEGSGRPFACTV